MVASLEGDKPGEHHTEQITPVAALHAPRAPESADLLAANL
jgi:hypothetical protein